MPLKNTAHRYGSVTKSLHWSVFLLVLVQYAGANVMTRIGRDSRVFGIGQDFLYDWHKSLGLVLLVLMVGRFAWRATMASGCSAAGTCRIRSGNDRR